MADDDVQLTDLEVIQRYSLAVRGATASRADLVAALQADLAWLQGGRRTAPAKLQAPVTAPAKVPAAAKASAPAKASAKVPAPARSLQKAPAKKAPARQVPARQAPAKTVSTKRKA